MRFPPRIHSPFRAHARLRARLGASCLRYRVPLSCPFHLPCISLATNRPFRPLLQVKIHDSLPTTHLLPTVPRGPLARAISMRVVSPFCGSIELALIHTDGTGKGLEVGLATKGRAGLDGLDRAKCSLLRSRSLLSYFRQSPYHAITTGAQYGLSASHRGCRYHHTLYYGCPGKSFLYLFLCHCQYSVL